MTGLRRWQPPVGYDLPVLQTPVAFPKGRVQVAAMTSSGSRDRIRGRS
jgi:hypothetical protein